MSVIQTILLTVKEFRIPETVHAVQNDTDRQLQMVVTDVTLSSGVEGRMTFERADGTYYFAEAEFQAATNSFLVDVDQALTCPGYTRSQLKITDINVVSTFDFYIEVQKDTSGVISEQEGISLTQAVEEAKRAARRAEAAGLSDQVKIALLACFEKLAWIVNNGQDYYDALEAALYPPSNLVSISAVYTQSGTVYDTDNLNSLKADLVVTALYDDETTETVASNLYSLSGTLEEGTSTITVRYSGKSTTFNVSVTAVLYDLQNQTVSRGGAYNTSINVLQADFPFTILFDMTTSENVTSGTASVVKHIFEYNTTNGYRGLAIGKATGNATVLSLWWEGDNDTAFALTGSSVSAGRHRIAVMHEANSNTIVVKYKYGNGSVLSFSKDSTFTTTTGSSLRFGAYGEANHCLPAGTLNLARLYGDVISAARIDEFFA